MADSKKKTPKKAASEKSKAAEEKKAKKKTAAKKAASKSVSQKKSTKKVVQKETAPKKKASAKTAGKPVKSPKKKSTPSKKTTKKNNKTTKALKNKNNLEPVQKNIQPIDPDAKFRGDIPMSLVGHLDELRSRIIIVLISIIIFSIVAFIFSDQIIVFINQPFTRTGHKLHIFRLAGGFFLKLKISFIIALLISIPLLLFEVWRFIQPAITVKDRTFSRVSLIFAALLFYGGASFVFFLVFPFAIPFLLDFIQGWETTIDANDYVNMLMLISLAMGFLFELPIIVMVLTRIGLITPYFLSRKRKFAVVIIFIIAAVITPQDIISQVMVAIPLLVLYEASIILSKITVKRNIKREKARDKEFDK